MNINLQKIGRIATATVLATGFVSAGIAASAQTTAAPATNTAASATNVSLSTAGDAKAKRKADLEALNAEARRVAFLHEGTSL